MRWWPCLRASAPPSRVSFCIRENLQEAETAQSVVLTTSEHIDLGRGDMLVSPGQLPVTSTRITAKLIWLSSTPLRKDVRYFLKHTTKTVVARVSRLSHVLDIDLFEERPADSLQFNEIGQVEFDLHTPIFCDPYHRKPRHRQLHHHRSSDERHGGRGHDRGSSSLPNGRRPRRIRHDVAG